MLLAAATWGAALAFATGLMGAVRQPKQADWPDAKLLQFTVADRPCVLVCPTQSAAGSPWIWRTEFFGHEPQLDQALLTRGWHVAYMNAKDLYGGPRAMALFDQFHRYLNEHYGLARRVVLEGFSRGGIYAFNYAVMHPDRVAALYLDGPILDIRTMRRHAETASGRDEWRNCLAAYGLTEETVNDYPGDPAGRAEPLLQAEIPLLILAGDADRIVPFAENSGALITRYRERGGTIAAFIREGGDHHPHSLKDPTPLVEFLTKHARF